MNTNLIEQVSHIIIDSLGDDWRVKAAFIGVGAVTFIIGAWLNKRSAERERDEE